MFLKTVFSKTFLVLGVACSTAFIASCSTTNSNDNYKGVYEAKKTTSHSLEVPPDLSSPDSSDALVIPSLSNPGSSYSEYAGASSNTTSNLLPKSASGVRFVRDGSMFWLEIDAKPEEVWKQVRSFFMDLGFSFVKENPINGMLQTNWLENRFDVPTGWFASLLGGLFSTGLMDKYRIRLERTENENVSLLFITHQGLKEQSYGNFSETDFSVKWQPRESDPELEAEMLQRFLIFRGIAKAKAKQLVSNSSGQDRVKAVKDDAGIISRLEVDEIFPRTWRRIGIALDRMGIVIEDRNRSKGLYFIKTTEDFVTVQEEEEGWFSSIFSSKGDKLQVTSFQLSVDDVGSKTYVKILNVDGGQDKTKTSQYVLEKLKVHLR